MEADLVTAELAFEESFGRPAFSVIEQQVPLLRAIYEVVSPRLAIASKDISSRGTGTLGDFLIQVGAANGNMTTTINADRWRAEFRNLKTQSDFAIALELPGLIQTPVLERIAPESLQTRGVYLSGHIQVNDKGFERNDFLKGLANPSVYKKVGSLGRGDLSHGITMWIGDLERPPISNFQLQRSLPIESGLYVSYVDFYPGNREWNTASTLLEKARDNLLALLSALTLTIQVPQ